MFRGSVKSTGYPLHSPISPSLPLPASRAITFQLESKYIRLTYRLTLESAYFVLGTLWSMSWCFIMPCYHALLLNKMARPTGHTLYKYKNYFLYIIQHALDYCIMTSLMTINKLKYFCYFVLWPTNAQLFHELSHCYMFRHYRVILTELVINTLLIYTSISNAAVGNTIYN